MSMQAKFEALVHDLDDRTLLDLTRSAVSEAQERARRSAIQVEHIRVGMTTAERDEAAREIARVLQSPLDR